MKLKILAIGATGFIGPFVIQRLQQVNHSVTVFHRGKTPAPDGVTEIIGDRNDLANHRATLERGQFDVVIDFVLSSARQARQLVDTLRAITSRVVALSSMDTYRAWGVHSGQEPGDLEALPVDEDSAVRTRQPYPPEVLEKLSQMVSWADDEYDKVPAERIVLGDTALPGTILRLPMIYGPGDYVHRFHPYLKRMDDRRNFILFSDDVGAMRTPRGYVEDVAAGIVLAALSDRSSRRIYNICEPLAFSELEWAKKIAAATGWQGEFIVLTREKTPPHLVWPYNLKQHLVVSSARIRQELGYREITSVDDAFQRTIAWERANPPRVIGIPFDYEAEDAAIKDLRATA